MIVNLEKKIRKRGNKWQVTNEAGTEVLGTHDTKAGAIRQLAAIESSKRRRHKKGYDMNEDRRIMEIEKELFSDLIEMFGEGEKE